MLIYILLVFPLVLEHLLEILFHIINLSLVKFNSGHQILMIVLLAAEDVNIALADTPVNHGSTI